MRLRGFFQQYLSDDALQETPGELKIPRGHPEHAQTHSIESRLPRKALLAIGNDLLPIQTPFFSRTPEPEPSLERVLLSRLRHSLLRNREPVPAALDRPPPGEDEHADVFWLRLQPWEGRVVRGREEDAGGQDGRLRRRAWGRGGSGSDEREVRRESGVFHAKGEVPSTDAVEVVECLQPGPSAHGLGTEWGETGRAHRVAFRKLQFDLGEVAEGNSSTEGALYVAGQLGVESEAEEWPIQGPQDGYSVKVRLELTCCRGSPNNHRRGRGRQGL